MRDALNFLTSAADVLLGGQALSIQAVSSNEIDLGAASKQPGLGGRQLYVHILVAVKAAVADDANTGRFELVHDAVSLVAGAVDVIAATNLLTGTDLTAGAHIIFPIPPGVLQQYLGWQWSPVDVWATSNEVQVISWVDDVAPNQLTVVS